MSMLQDLLAALDTYLLDSRVDPTKIPIQEIVFDNRQVKPGALFVALQGRSSDGHRFIADAAVRGASAAVGVLSRQEAAAKGFHFPEEFPYIQVANSRLALAQCAAALHGFPSRRLTVIGVTGTDGKTTTSSLIESILVAATGSASNPEGRVGVVTTVAARIRGEEIDTGLHVTTPDAPDVQRYLARIRDSGCQFAILESTSHGLNQSRVAAVDFDVAAVTNITHEHLDEHGTRDAYVAAKAKLFRALYQTPAKPSVPKCAVLNLDDGGSIHALRAALAEEAHAHGFTLPVRSYGVAGVTPHETADVIATGISYLPDRTELQVRWWGGKFTLQTQLIGDFNVYNTLCAVTVALALGIELPVIQQGVARFAGVLGRMQRMDRGQPFLAVVDFAHTPVSLERALITLRKLVGSGPAGEPGRLIAVFGSAGLRDREKRRLMGRVSGRLADFTVITAEDPRTEDLNLINAEIAAGVREFAAEQAFTIVPDRTEAIQFAVNMARPGDVVGAFGKGHERSMCFGEIEYPWSDQEAMLQALEQRLNPEPKQL